MTDHAELIARLRELLARAKPAHYHGECGHCGIDELPPETCPTLAFIAEIDAALTADRAAEPPLRDDEPVCAEEWEAASPEQRRHWLDLLEADIRRLSERTK